MAFEIKRNDRRPRYRVQLTESKVPVDLTAAQAADFTMKKGSSVKVLNGPMTFIDRVNGWVEYAWEPGDTDTSGTYNVEVRVDWGNDETQTFPSKRYFIVAIGDDLDNA